LSTELRAVPNNPTIIALHDVTLTCEPLIYQGSHDNIRDYKWHRVGGDISENSTGKMSNRLTIPRVVPADEGQYYCTAEQFEHCAESNKVTVKVDGEKIVPCMYVRMYVCMYVHMYDLYVCI